MKKYLLLMFFCAVLLTPMKTKAQGWNYNYDVFYSSLAPYGEWVTVDFGYAWRPLHVAYGWRPYMYGRWVWTDYGWYWVSSEPFGWAAFHYGRWHYDDFYGWVWIPDNVWGPAWVEWRYNDDYIGWAPLSPYAQYSVNVGITFTKEWTAPNHYWNFVPVRHFASARVDEHVQPIEHTPRIFGSTRGSIAIRTEGERVVNRGIDVNFVQQRGNVRINRVDVISRGSGERFVREANRERVEVYRPKLERRGNDKEEREHPVGRIENQRRPMPAKPEKQPEKIIRTERGFEQRRMREIQPWPPNSQHQLKDRGETGVRHDSKGAAQRPPSTRTDRRESKRLNSRPGERKP